MNHEDKDSQEKGLEALATFVVDASFRVHTALGPGLLELVYETCLAHEFHKHGIPFQRQLNLPIEYDGVKLDAGLRLDLIVADLLIVEVKAVEAIHPLHIAQTLTYLKLTRRKLGLLINFNVPRIKDGIRRVIL